MDYKICSKCVMDTVGDPFIRFDSDGICNYWNDAEKKRVTEYFPNEEGRKRLARMIEEIHSDPRGEYDCIIGLSGGLDSSYLAYLAADWGLKILAVHCNDGFDASIGTKNVACLTEYTKFHLETIQVDLEQFYRINAAYMRAGVPNLAVPQDNLITSGILQLARENHIRYFLSGINYALECILQKGNTITNKDTANLYDIFRKYGHGDIGNLHFMSPMKADYYYKVLKIKTFAPLNYVDYNMNRAIQELHDACGFSYYGGKHYENTFTKFAQQIWLVEKFNVDKRKSHYSSLIASGQLSREEALEMLKKPVISPEERDRVIKEVSNKMGISVDEIEAMLQTKGVQHDAYRTSKYLLVKNKMKKVL